MFPVDLPASSDCCLSALFEAQAGRTPHAIALSREHHSMSYRELDERSNVLARRLVSVGVKAEVLVGICIERSFDLVVAVLGVLKAGGAYVPLVAKPTERLESTLSSAKIAIVVTQAHLLDTLPRSAVSQILCIDDGDSRGEARGRLGKSDCSGDALAYVMHTSGSSGSPKGVMVSNRSVCNVVSSMQARYPLSSKDVVLQWIPFSFDGSVCDFYWPLFVGARLVLLDPETYRDPVYMADVIEAQSVTAVVLVPTMLAALTARSDIHTQLQSLRLIVCGGEALAPGLARAFLEFANSAAVLVNAYGPTETTVLVSTWSCKRDVQEAFVPIGTPIAGTRLYVLTESMNEVTAAESGELYVEGPGLARGYLNQRALTAEYFVPNPYSDVASSRMYRTGDRVRRHSDGALEYLGRSDTQVKIRGFRIELGEIESILLRHPAVREAVVIVSESGSESASLIAFVVLSDDNAIVPIRDALQRALPDYMLPRKVVVMRELPVTSTGKVDRARLSMHSLCEDDYEAPSSALELLLSTVISDVLGGARIGVTSHFRECGVNSLRAIQIAHLVCELLGPKLTSLDLLVNHTIVELIGSPVFMAVDRAKLERDAQRALDILSLSDEEAERIEASLLDDLPVNMSPEE